MSGNDAYWQQARNVTFRTGIVEEIGSGAQLGYVRVRFPERDNVTSGWLNVLTKGTQGTKEWWLPQLGAQVQCDMDEHDEQGCVTGEMWSTADPPVSDATPTQRRTDYSDGSVMLYDTATHEFSLSIVAGGTGTIAIAGGPSLVMDGGTGKMTMADPSGTTLVFSNNGVLALTGNLAVSGEITDINGAGSVNELRTQYNAHTHGNVQNGAGNTGTTSNPAIP